MKSSILKRAGWIVMIAIAAGNVSVGMAQDAKATGAIAPMDKPLPLSEPRPSAASTQAWADRKFGMFIHFGLYSMLGGVWQGKQINNGYSEQIMANAPIPLDEYSALAGQFNPAKFDADAIVALAKAAGMKFIVITSKHHDGFNMFHTAQTKYNVVDATPYKRDVVKELEEACARGGIKFGVYYSSIDWHYPGASSYIEGNSNPIPKKHEDFNVAQLKELMTGYGPISEIWFDMGKPTPAQSKRFAETVHRLQPQTMVSGRIFNYEGDFTVMGDNEVPAFQIDEPWQTPASIFHETWGYRSWQQRPDVSAKIDENILRLVQVVSRGGNYILNIGPEGDGSVVPYEAEVLRGVGAWLKVNGEAIYATSAQPFRKLDFGYATVGKDKLYLFVKELPKDRILRLPGLVGTRVGAGYVLGDGTKLPLKSSHDAQETRLELPKNFGVSGRFLPVVVLPFEGALHVAPPTVAATPDGSFVLTPEEADRFYNYNGYGYEDPATLYKLRWFAATKPGRYTLQVDYNGATASAAIDIVVNGQRERIALPVATEKTSTKTVKLQLTAAVTNVEVTPVEPFHKGTPLPAHVLTVRLVPDKP